MNDLLPQKLYKKKKGKHRKWPKNKTDKMLPNWFKKIM